MVDADVDVIGSEDEGITCFSAEAQNSEDEMAVQGGDSECMEIESDDEVPVEMPEDSAANPSANFAAAMAQNRQGTATTEPAQPVAVEEIDDSEEDVPSPQAPQAQPQIDTQGNPALAALPPLVAAVVASAAAAPGALVEAPAKICVAEENHAASPRSSAKIVKCKRNPPVAAKFAVAAINNMPPDTAMAVPAPATEGSSDDVELSIAASTVATASATECPGCTSSTAPAGGQLELTLESVPNNKTGLDADTRAFDSLPCSPGSNRAKRASEDATDSMPPPKRRPGAKKRPSDCAPSEKIDKKPGMMLEQTVSVDTDPVPSPTELPPEEASSKQPSKRRPGKKKGSSDCASSDNIDKNAGVLWEPTVSVDSDPANDEKPGANDAMPSRTQLPSAQDSSKQPSKRCPGKKKGSSDCAPSEKMDKISSVLSEQASADTDPASDKQPGANDAVPSPTQLPPAEDCSKPLPKRRPGKKKGLSDRAPSQKIDKNADGLPEQAASDEKACTNDVMPFPTQLPPAEACLNPQVTNQTSRKELGGGGGGKSCAKVSDPSQQKAAKLTKDEMSTKIVNYMTQQNRPYNAQNIFDNLHGAVPKGQVQTILDDLSSSGKMLVKEFGKLKVYLAMQADISKSDADQQLEKLQGAIVAFQISNKGSKENLDKAKGTVVALRKEREMLVQAKTIEHEIYVIISRLAHLTDAQGSGDQVDTTDVCQAENDFAAAHKAWKSRKRLCMEVICTLCERSDFPVQKMIDKYGIDTDDACGHCFPTQLIV